MRSSIHCAGGNVNVVGIPTHLPLVLVHMHTTMQHAAMIDVHVGSVGVRMRLRAILWAVAMGVLAGTSFAFEGQFHLVCGSHCARARAAVGFAMHMCVAHTVWKYLHRL